MDPPWGLVDARPIVARLGTGPSSDRRHRRRSGRDAHDGPTSLRGLHRPAGPAWMRARLASADPSGRLRRRPPLPQRDGRRHGCRPLHRRGVDRLAPTHAAASRAPALPHRRRRRDDGAAARVATALGSASIARATLAAQDVRVRDGLPLTAPARTILDLAGAEGFEAALNEARAIRRDHRPGPPRSSRSAIAETAGGPAPPYSTLSSPPSRTPASAARDAEEILRGLIRRAGLPLPQRNVRLHGAELDFYWPLARLNAEVDGFAAHGRRRNFESDRDRDAASPPSGSRSCDSPGGS